MAKAKRRVPKKSSKRPPAHKKTATRAAPKKARSKARTIARGARKAAAKKRRPPKIPARKTLKRRPVKTTTVPVEDTIVDIVDELAPGVIRVTEYETLRAIVPDADNDDETEAE